MSVQKIERDPVSDNSRSSDILDNQKQEQQKGRAKWIVRKNKHLCNNLDPKIL